MEQILYCVLMINFLLNALNIKNYFKKIKNRACVRGGGANLTFIFFYCTARQQTFSESQQLEAWPASIYGHLREG